MDNRKIDVLKPISLLLALRIRQIFIPLVFLEYTFSYWKVISYKHTSFWKIGKLPAFCGKWKRTSKSAPIEYSDSTTINDTMENSAVASE